MKRLLVLPAFLLIFMLFLSAAPADDNSSEAQYHIKTGIGFYEQGHSEAYSNQTLLDEALEEFNKALLIDPNSAEARYYLGLTCLAMNARICAEKQYQMLKDLDAEMADKLKAQIVAYRTPLQFEHLKTSGEAWTPPVEEKAPATNTPGPEASTTPEGRKSCEIASFSTYDKPGEVRRFSQGGSIYEEPQRCVTATIRNTGTSKVSANEFMIEAKFSDGDTMKERIDSSIPDMKEVEPGGTVTGSACFKKDKATITVVECGMW